MSWLCDLCGYENSYDDSIKNTVCVCCGEPASDEKISQARIELNLAHKKEERRLRFEQHRKRLAIIQDKIDKVLFCVMCGLKHMPVVSVFLLFITGCFLALSWKTEGMTVLKWDYQMRGNIKCIKMVESGILGDNEKIIIKSVQKKLNFTVGEESILNKIRSRSACFKGNINNKRESIDRINEQIDDNYKLYYEKKLSIKETNDFYSFWNNRIRLTKKNYRRNIDLFEKHAKFNGHKFILFFQRRG